MEKQQKIVTSLLMAAILCAGSAVSLAVLSTAGSTETGSLITGVNSGLAPGLATESLGSVTIPEDEDYLVWISECFYEGWESISFQGNEFIEASYTDEFIYLLPQDDWYGVESIDISAYYNISIGPPPVEDEQLAVSDDLVISSGFMVTKSLMVDVLPVNDPPRIISSLPRLDAQSGATIPNFAYLDEHFVDIDSDISFFASVETPYIAAYIADGVMGVEVGTMASGPGQISIFATDGEYAVCDQVEAEIGRASQISFDEDRTYMQLLDDYFPYPPTSVKCVSSGSLDVATGEMADGTWAASIDAPYNWNGAGMVTLEGLLFQSIGPRPDKDECATPDENEINSLPGYWYKSYISLATDVLPVNDAPRLVPQLFGPLTIDEDTSLFNVMDVANLFYDVDSELGYSVSSKEGIVTPSLSYAHFLSAVAEPDAYGSDIIEVSATDGEFVVVAELPVDVMSVNDVPSSEFDGTIVETLEDVSVHVDVLAMFEDVDDSTLVYSFNSSANFTVTIDQVNGTAQITPSQDWNGVELLTLTADDGEDTSSVSVYAVVTSVNDPVSLISDAQPLSFREDGSGSVYLDSLFFDVDSDISLSAETECSGLTVEVSNGRLHVSADDDWNGYGSVVVTASDGQYSATCAVDVTVSSVNDDPVALSAIGDISVNEDGTAVVEMDKHFVDIDGALSYQVTGAATISATVDASGSLAISAPENWYGSETIRVTATDGEAEVHEDLTVTFTPVNDAPVLVSRMQVATFAGGSQTTIDLAGYFVDPDGDVLSYAVTTPEGITAMVDQTNGVATISAPANLSGAGEITVTATDGYATTSLATDVVVTTTQSASAGAGLPVEAGYILGGGMMAMSVLAAVGLSMYAREAGINRTARSRVKNATTASA